MTMTAKTISRRKRAMAAFAMAFVTCLLGLAFFLVKSPQAKSESFLAAATVALEMRDTAAATRAAYEAVRLNPASAKGWKMLSSLLQQNGHAYEAGQARQIALKLEQNPDSMTPVYAMPAELKLSLLAMGSQGTP